MCTAIGFKGSDIIYGFNLDVDPEVWDYKIYKTEDFFTVGIKVGSTVYYTHGVRKDGSFGNLPYMNGEPYSVPRGAKRERIDLMINKYIRGKYSFDDLKSILSTKTLVNAPSLSMHSLIGNGSGELIIAEPGYGTSIVSGNYAALTNFPVLANLTDYSNPFFGKERYDRTLSLLRNAADLSVSEAIDILYGVRSEGQWATRVTFVYSHNEKCVYYYLNGDKSHIMTHNFT